MFKWLLCKIHFKLKEQGTQRGLLLLSPLIANRFGLSPEDTLTITSGILAIYGTHNIVTPG